MASEVLTVAMLAIMAVGIFSGFPVAMVLAGTGFLGFGAAAWLGLTDFRHLGLIYFRVRGVLTNEGVQFTSVPMLIFLGLVLNASGIAETLFRTIGALLRSLPGRHAVATLLIGLILAPAAGVIGASVVTVALVAYGPMLASGYPPRMAGSAVAASGALGVVFPPAIMLFFVANQFHLRIGLMYVALVIPVAIMVAVFAMWFVLARRGRRETDIGTGTGASASDAVTVLAAIAVIAAIPLSIVAGVATLSEAAGIGVFGGLAVALARRRLTLRLLNRAVLDTATMTSMVFFIVIGATIFSLGFNLVGGPEVLFAAISALDLGRWSMLAALLGVVMVLGFVFDWMEILLVFLPILMPFFEHLDFADHVGSGYFAKIWIGALIALALQTSFLTPPFGYALFFAKMAAPSRVQLADIYRGAIPLVVLEVAILAALVLWPSLITWLPEAAARASDTPIFD